MLVQEVSLVSFYSTKSLSAFPHSVTFLEFCVIMVSQQKAFQSHLHLSRSQHSLSGSAGKILCTAVPTEGFGAQARCTLRNHSFLTLGVHAPRRHEVGFQETSASSKVHQCTPPVLEESMSILSMDTEDLLCLDAG